MDGLWCLYCMWDVTELPSHHVSSVSCWVDHRAGGSQVIVTLVISRDRAHGQSVLLADRVQLLGVDSLSDELQLFSKGLAAVRHTDVRDVSTADVVARRTLVKVGGAQPVAFGLKSRRNT